MAANTGKTAPFVITRIFDAPRELVFRVWTEAEHLAHWFGPKGNETTSATVDLRPGGIFLYGMKMPDGGTMWGKWIFREILPPEKLVVVISFSDAEGGLTRHPYSPDWPLHTLSTMTFAERGNKTTVTIEWYPLDATEAEARAFDTGRDGMTMGWTGTFDRLEDYLAKI